MIGDNPQVMAEKQPRERKDYTFDFGTRFLPAGVTITSQTVQLEAGSDGLLVIDQVTRPPDNRSVIVWVTAGTDLVDYTVYCLAVCSNGGQYERDMVIPVRARVKQR